MRQLTPSGSVIPFDSACLSQSWGSVCGLSLSRLSTAFIRHSRGGPWVGVGSVGQLHPRISSVVPIKFVQLSWLWWSVVSVLLINSVCASRLWGSVWWWVVSIAPLGRPSWSWGSVVERRWCGAAASLDWLRCAQQSIRPSRSWGSVASISFVGSVPASQLWGSVCGSVSIASLVPFVCHGYGVHGRALMVWGDCVLGSALLRQANLSICYGCGGLWVGRVFSGGLSPQVCALLPTLCPRAASVMVLDCCWATHFPGYQKRIS